MNSSEIDTPEKTLFYPFNRCLHYTDSAVLITKQHFLGGVEVTKDKENDI